jgi:NAD(P)-dependent dehydrogenase (short-subunit alcohol dehydrogenase family)
MSGLVPGAALVTGGGSGIGQAIARTLGRAGAPVAVIDLRPESGEESVALIAEQGGQATFLRGDVSRWEDVDRLFAAAVDELL